MKQSIALLLVGWLAVIGLGSESKETFTSTLLEDPLAWATFQAEVSIPNHSIAEQELTVTQLSGGHQDVHFYTHVGDKAYATMFSFSRPMVSIVNEEQHSLPDGRILHTADISYRFCTTAKITDPTFVPPPKPIVAKTPGLESVELQSTRDYTTYTIKRLLPGHSWIEPAM
jgi:hypothetical protein